MLPASSLATGVNSTAAQRRGSHSIARRYSAQGGLCPVVSPYLSSARFRPWRNTAAAPEVGLWDNITKNIGGSQSLGLPFLHCCAGAPETPSAYDPQVPIDLAELLFHTGSLSPLPRNAGPWAAWWRAAKWAWFEPAGPALGWPVKSATHASGSEDIAQLALGQWHRRPRLKGMPKPFLRPFLVVQRHLRPMLVEAPGRRHVAAR